MGLVLSNSSYRRRKKKEEEEEEEGRDPMLAPCAPKQIGERSGCAEGFITLALTKQLHTRSNFAGSRAHLQGHLGQTGSPAEKQPRVPDCRIGSHRLSVSSGHCINVPIFLVSCPASADTWKGECHGTAIRQPLLSPCWIPAALSAFQIQQLKNHS